MGGISEGQRKRGSESDFADWVTERAAFYRKLGKGYKARCMKRVVNTIYEEGIGLSFNINQQLKSQE